MPKGNRTKRTVKNRAKIRRQRQKIRRARRNKALKRGKRAR